MRMWKGTCGWFVMTVSRFGLRHRSAMRNAQCAMRINTPYGSKWAGQYAIRNTQYAMKVKLGGPKRSQYAIRNTE